MRRRRFAAAMMGIGTAAALVLPVSGAFADPVRDRPVSVQARYNDRGGGYGGRGGYDSRDGYGRKDGYDRRSMHDRYDRRGDRDRNLRDGRRDSRGGNENLPYLLGGVLLGTVLAGRR